MAEQGIEQAAKAGLLAGTPWVTWDKLDKTGQEFWLRIARAMQPHLAPVAQPSAEGTEAADGKTSEA